MADQNQARVLHSKANDGEWAGDHFLRGELHPADHQNATAEKASQNSPETPSARLADLRDDIEYPLLDAALQATRRDSHVGVEAEYHPTVADLQRETGRLVESASLLADGSARFAVDEATVRKRQLEGRIRERPLLVLGLVATLAYVLGVTR